MDLKKYTEKVIDFLDEFVDDVFDKVDDVVAEFETRAKDGIDYLRNTTADEPAESAVEKDRRDLLNYFEYRGLYTLADSIRKDDKEFTLEYIKRKARNLDADNPNWREFYRNKARNNAQDTDN